ncbi:MAG: hypothetical protein IJ449_10790 [Clostridia bacterium]|nr:hypothetical protein [Clostridia bacterium]
MKLSKPHEIQLKALINICFEQDSPKRKREIHQDIIRLIEASSPDSIEIEPVDDIATNDLLLCMILVITMYGFFSITIPDNNPENIMFSALFRTICNSIYSILLLAENGLDYAAKTQLRILLEQFFILISVTCDKEKRNSYIKNYEGKEAATSWYKNFKKDKFIAMINAFLPEEVEIRKALTEVVNGYYGEYSSFIHNDYLFVLCYSMAHINDTDNRPNICGQYQTRLHEILMNCFSISINMSYMFFHILDMQDVDMNIDTVIGSEKLNTQNIFSELNRAIRYLSSIIISREELKIT